MSVFSGRRHHQGRNGLSHPRRRGDGKELQDHAGMIEVQYRYIAECGGPGSVRFEVTYKHSQTPLTDSVGKVCDIPFSGLELSDSCEQSAQVVNTVSVFYEIQGRNRLDHRVGDVLAESNPGRDQDRNIRYYIGRSDAVKAQQPWRHDPYLHRPERIRFVP